MAGNDMYEWNQSLATLPAGQGSITALGGGLYTITVMWDEQRNGATGTNCDPNDDSDLRCVSLTTQP
jgi:type IV pilus assembly protein PilV